MAQFTLQRRGLAVAAQTKMSSVTAGTDYIGDYIIGR